MADPNRALFESVVRLLAPVLDELVFVGGCTTGLFITDSAAGGIRPTRDVDAIVDVASYSKYTALAERLRGLGLAEDTTPGAPLCRWRRDDLIVDVMPVSERILGFSNRWYPAAIGTAQSLNIAGHDVRVVTPALFIATKLEAFHGRGGDDVWASHDLEDITRDKLGRIIGRGEVIDDVTRVLEYRYDAAGRLAAWLRNGSVVASYGYDANGNRTSVTTDAGTVTATYDDQDRILTLGDITYTHTANGERLTKTVSGQTTTYAYDAFGNLVRADLPDGRVIRYLVDGRNRRIGKLVNDVLVKRWLFGDQLRPIAELDGQGNIVTRFVYGSRTNIPDYFTRDGVDYRIVTDHLGSPRVVINTQTREIVQRMDFDPWGVVTQDSNPGFQPFGFAGGLYDTDSNLIRFGARDYDTETGAWLSKDPIGFNASSNFYSYAENSPVNHVDQSGLDIFVIEGGPTAGNPIGHTAVGISGQGVFSYGTETPLGSSIEQYLLDQARYRSSTVWVLDTTDAQDRAALRAVTHNRALGQVTDNCSSRSNDILDAAGIPQAPENPYLDYSTTFPNWPGSAGERAATAGGRSYFIPQGSTSLPPGLVSSIRQ